MHANADRNDDPVCYLYSFRVYLPPVQNGDDFEQKSIEKKTLFSMALAEMATKDEQLDRCFD